MDLNDRVFLITGGGSGLGAATAAAFVSAGARVVLADIQQAAGQQQAQKLGAAARFVPADVTRADDVAAAVQEAREAFGGLHGAVNCAGLALGMRILGRDGPHGLDEFVRVVQVNLVGTFNVLRLAAQAIAQMPEGTDGERGVIINTASCAAFEGQIGQAAYAASKAGVAGMTLPAARELARFGIRVVTIAPGTFDTPMMAHMPPQVRQSLLDQIPFPRRLGQPEEYAALARHIVENRMLNGCVLRLDGALRMGAR
jgi:NAD(P)-dependent dehydrogenase (short-subunit alcohol dehydrogenase family)